MKTRVILVAVLAAALAGCAKKAENEPPVATATLTLSRAQVALGSPVEERFKFVVASGARIPADYRVFVHYLDADGEMMWADDHVPTTPTSQWKAGQVIEYTRTIFVPVYPYVGDASIEIGLYRPGAPKRLPLVGQERGKERAYKVAKFQLKPQTDNVFLIFKDGWNQEEVAPDNPSLRWQWTKKEGTIVFKNPGRNCTFFLDLDGRPRAFEQPQVVSVSVGGQVVNSFPLDFQDEQIRRIPITAAQMGSTDMVELKVTVDRSFVPALLPASANRDPRELGVRVFHAFVLPD